MYKNGLGPVCSSKYGHVWFLKTKMDKVSNSECLCLVLQGLDEGPDGLRLISDIIREKLEIEVSVLMGANIANEVADEKFCETTIGGLLFFSVCLTW